MQITLTQADCLVAMKDLPDQSVDAIITDPPYFRIRGNFDFIWGSFEEYLSWVELLALEFKRVLKPNGSLLWFGDDKNIAYCQIIFDKHFNFLNHLVWDKIHPIHKGENSYRMFGTRTERILFYSSQEKNTDFSDLKNYFKKVQTFLGFSLKKINSTLGHRKAEHAFYWNASQWNLPAQETYQELIEVFKINEMEDFREYQSLREEYEQTRRPFNYQKGIYEIIRHLPDIFVHGKNEHHITQKPVFLMQKLIEICTNENQVVLDPFCGSGTTGVACLNTNRNFIGYELDPEYFKIAKTRIENAQTTIENRVI